MCRNLFYLYDGFKPFFFLPQVKSLAYNIIGNSFSNLENNTLKTVLMHGVKSLIYQCWEIDKISGKMVCNWGVQFRYVNDDW